ncbi:MAG: hypothetical protein IJ777_01330 [Clostridia bacterium]|nr:hypothetical protein [Clostridia bacterium]
MSNLIEYIKRMKQYQEEHPEISEKQLVRHIYLDLGSRLSFDLEFYFGNSKTRQEIYKNSGRRAIEKCMENEIAICKSMAYIVEYILNELGVNVIVVVAPGDERKCPHMYNIIQPQEGAPYIIDLQEDIRYIQSHSRTQNFGLSIKEGGNPVISFAELEAMDKEDGYISDENYYADDYLYFLRSQSELIEDLREKAKLIFENLEPYDNHQLQVADRTRHLEELIMQLFTIEEQEKIHIIDCYYEEKDKKNYQNCIAVYASKDADTDIYQFSEKDQRFYKKTIDEFAKEVEKGLKHKQAIWGLNRALKKLENQER